MKQQTKPTKTTNPKRHFNKQASVFYRWWVAVTSLYNLVKNKFLGADDKQAVKRRAGPRRLKKPNYKSFRLHKRIKPTQPSLPSAWKIFKKTLALVWRHKRQFLWFTIIYALLTLILVNGFGSSLNTADLKQSLSDVADGNLANLTIAVTLFGAMVSSAGNTVSATGGIYQTVLLLIFSLSVIWFVRKQSAGEVVSVKDSLYKGMYPLIPFLLVLFVIGLQLIPAAIGNWFYNVVVANGIAVLFIEKALWAILFGLLVGLSIYMISSSIFALIIVTLPSMMPMQALRSARQLVIHRRWMVIRKLLFLPIGMVLLAMVIMLPVILWLTVIADWLFFVLTLAGTIFTLIYVYLLYRELLNE